MLSRWRRRKGERAAGEGTPALCTMDACPPVGGPSTPVLENKPRAHARAGRETETMSNETMSNKTWETNIRPAGGYSAMIILPRDVMDRLGLSRGDTVGLTLTVEGLLVTPLTRRPRMVDLGVTEADLIEGLDSQAAYLEEEA